MRKNLPEDLADEWDTEFLKVDGHDNACMGVVYGCAREPVLLYKRSKIIKNLMKSGMTRDEATEFCEFNIEGAYMGEKTPLFLF